MAAQEERSTASVRGGPERITEVVKVDRWTCNVIGHRHRDSTSAAQCMAKRKGEIGELKKLRRNISILQDIRKGTPLTRVSERHACSDTNVIKAVNSMLSRARALTNPACPYPARKWTRAMLVDPRLTREIEWLLKVLQEHEVQLAKLVGI